MAKKEYLTKWLLSSLLVFIITNCIVSAMYFIKSSFGIGRCPMIVENTICRMEHVWLFIIQAIIIFGMPISIGISIFLGIIFFIKSRKK